jgi:copper(I)-binding protein
MTTAHARAAHLRRDGGGVPRLTAILAPLLLAASAATAHSYQLGPLHIGHPWIQAPPPGAPTAAGYLSVTNTGAAPDRLLGGATPLFARLEVHRMTMTGGIMRMRPAAGGLEIAPGQTVILSPGGGYHLMLTGPKRPLAPGDHVPATLSFARAGTIRVDFHVQAGPGGDGAMPGMKMP